MNRALIVDDHDENIYYLRALLERNGWAVESAHHGAEALTKAKMVRPDLVISDLLMPVMDGYTLLRNWKADTQLRGVPFVVYTATYTDPGDERLARSLGADAFLLKPLEPDQLLAQIAEVRKGGGSPSPAPGESGEGAMLEVYNRTLVRKLEHKMLQLEEANRQLKEQELAMRIRDRAFCAVSQGIVIADAQAPHAPIVFVNQAFERMTGYALAEVAGRDWLFLQGSDTDPAAVSEIRRALAEQRDCSVELLNYRKDGGTFWVQLALAPVADTTGRVTHFVGVLTDVTERRELAAKMMAMDRMIAVATLAAGVGHEINNPLAYIQANLSFALSELAKSTSAGAKPAPLSEVATALNDAAHGAERVRKIVADLKSIARSDSQERSGSAELAKVLDSALAMSQHVVRPKARLVRELGALPSVRGDEGRLVQVFLNLVVNAAQAIPAGDPEHHEIRVRAAALDSEWVQIEVRDTGAGISPEIRRLMFEPFFTTKPVGVGTGLGLAICKRIIDDAGGKIEVESEVGKGATFRVMLRVSAEAAPQRPETPAASPGEGRRRVLVVDDEVLMLRAITRSLGPVHEVTAVGSAREGLGRISGGERFDLILCDMSMPGMDGRAFHAELTRVAPDQARRLSFLTGGASGEAARRFLDGPGISRLDKPFSRDELLDFVAHRLAELAPPAP